MELLLIRHGRPHEVVTEGSDERDPRLSPEGVRHADRLAIAIARGDYGRVTAIVTSPMTRARETAQAVADRLHLPVEIEPRIAELDDGAVPYFAGPGPYGTRKAMWDAVNGGEWGTYRFDPRVFAARVYEGIERIIAAHPDGLVAVFCHGGVMSSYVARIVGATRPFLFAPAFTAVSRVLATPDGHRELLSMNERVHLTHGAPE